MSCSDESNWCILSLVSGSISSLMFLVSSYQSYRYFMNRYATKNLKSIIFTTNILTLCMSLHFFLMHSKYRELLVLMEFFLYLNFCLIAMFYVKQASVYLDDSSILIKIAKYLLYIVIGILTILFTYVLVIVSAKILDYDNCSNLEWKITRYLTFFIGISFFIVGIKISYQIKKKKKMGLRIEGKREQELWYNNI
jgi:hypothetical protein